MSETPANSQRLVERTIDGFRAIPIQTRQVGDDWYIERLCHAGGPYYAKRIDLSHWLGKPLSLWAAAPAVCSLDLDKEAARLGPAKAKTDEQKPMSKWEVTTDQKLLRRLGKLLEELGEASAVAARIIIQGVDEVDPGSRKVNRERLMDELADVQAQIGCTVLYLDLDQDYMACRTARKIRNMAEWERLVALDEKPSAAARDEACPDIYKTAKFHVGGFVRKGSDGARKVEKSPLPAEPYGKAAWGKGPLLTETADYAEEGSWGRASVNWPKFPDYDEAMRHFVIKTECVPYGAYVTVGNTLRIHPDYVDDFKKAWVNAHPDGA